MNKKPAEKEFRSEFLNCCSKGCCTCIGAYCCPCFIYGENEQTIKKDDKSTWYTVMYMGASYFLGFGSCLIGMQRKTLRVANGIEGNLCADICLSLCCHPCVLVQNKSELERSFDN